MKKLLLVCAVGLSLADCASLPAAVQSVETNVNKVAQNAPTVGQQVGQVASDLVNAAIALTGPITSIVALVSTL